MCNGTLQLAIENWKQKLCQKGIRKWKPPLATMNYSHNFLQKSVRITGFATKLAKIRNIVCLILPVKWKKWTEPYLRSASSKPVPLIGSDSREIEKIFLIILLLLRTAECNHSSHFKFTNKLKYSQQFDKMLIWCEYFLEKLFSILLILSDMVLWTLFHVQKSFLFTRVCKDTICRCVGNYFWKIVQSKWEAWRIFYQF